MNLSIRHGILFLFSTLACFSSLLSQGLPQEDLQWLHHRYRSTNRTAMAVLGSWSAVNLVYSGIALGQHRGEERYFHSMNVGWGAVNGLIAGVGWLQARRLPKQSGPAQQVLKRQSDLQQILALNTGLDLAYMAGGLWMMERGHQNQMDDALLRGFGKSLILQGGFLFVYDMSLWMIHRHSTNRFLQRITLHPTSHGFGLILNIQPS